MVVEQFVALRRKSWQYLGVTLRRRMGMRRILPTPDPVKACILAPSTSQPDSLILPKA